MYIEDSMDVENLFIYM